MKRFLMGNESIALGALLEGADSVYSYPGTPASEILPAFREFAPDRYVQWSLNEKIALELAVSEAVAGRSVLCAMKQVGLNVAADPLFSSAYTGVEGALVIVSADDPGPYSSQTEQDSRMYAVSAKIPVFDPVSPADALRLTRRAYGLSREFRIPVMLRPVMRVCHSRQEIDSEGDVFPVYAGEFHRNPDRWAATPRHRSVLHVELIEKLERIAMSFRPPKVQPRHKTAIIGSGYPMAIMMDAQAEYSLPLDIITVDMPFPLSADFIDEVENAYASILVLEETFPVIENQFRKCANVRGKKDGTVPCNGEMTFDSVRGILGKFLGIELKADRYCVLPAPPVAIPRLCPGCGHRAAFYSIRRAIPHGIYPGDIGCYTLGTNLGAVDTVLDMGASITFAEGLKRSIPGKPVVATIGDSTFFHSGIPALINARVNRSPIVIAILDNATTAMTGFQPVPHSGGDVSLEAIIRGIGIDFCVTIDPDDITGSVDLLRKALEHADTNRIPAVVIFNRQCITQTREKSKRSFVIGDDCTDCRVCYKNFECPAIVKPDGGRHPEIDRLACTGCGVCMKICPAKCIVEVS